MKAQINTFSALSGNSLTRTVCRLLDNRIPPADNELSGIAKPKGTPRLLQRIAINTIFGKVRQSLIGNDNGKLRLPTSYSPSVAFPRNANNRRRR